MYKTDALSNKRKLQSGVNLFAFLLAFPGIEVLGNSLYFYIFLWLLNETRKETGKFVLKSRFSVLLLATWATGIVSTIFHPELIEGSNSIFDSALTLLRYSYWFLIATYFYSWKSNINLYQLSKWLTLGYILQVVCFYFLSFTIDLVFVRISTGISRNSFVFNSILLSGFVFFYFYSRFGTRSFWIVGFSLFSNLILTNGRAGALIAFIIIVLNYSLIKEGFRLSVKVGLLICLVMISTSDIDKTIYGIGEKLAPAINNYSPRFADLLRGSGDGDLSFDKSWLVRELMIDKTLEIINVHPGFGVGLGNFSRFNAPLTKLNTEKYTRLRSHSKDYYNTRSAHNSYANYLGEAGIIGFSLLILLFWPVIYTGLSEFWSGRYRQYGFEFVLIIGLLGGMIHGYSISAFTGANLWFTLGFCRKLLKR